MNNLTPEQWNKHREAYIWFHDNECKIPLLYTTTPLDDEAYLPQVSTPSWSINMDYIINDEYVEIRKAIYEGKTIVFNQDNKLNWTDPNTPSITMYGIDKLSIKDKHKFEVGVWIKSIADNACQIKNITYNSYVMTDGNEFNLHFVNSSFKLWEPKVNEWCWFYNKHTKKEPALRKFSRLTKLGNKYISTSGYVSYDCIEPFIGQPSTVHTEWEKHWS